MKQLIPIITAVLLSLLPLTSKAQDQADSLYKIGDLYVVATSHLDTQWRWTIQKSITDYIPATFRDNFTLFELYPDYIFSFEGAFRYSMLREYYPEMFDRLKGYIAQGRWKPCGSMWDACDVNVPSPESLTRQVLYGNGFFKREFGVQSYDIFLPDCFGFGYALPSVAAHCGLKGFSTQKLAWGSAIGIPFDIGMWEGVDGSALVAAVNPGDYVGKIQSDLSYDSLWTARVRKQGEISGLRAAYRYFGVGDTGGAPDTTSVEWLQKSFGSTGPLNVHSVGADYLSTILTDEQKSKLPHYKGELIMTRHGVGCYTSQAAMKRWNRKNELLADASERANVIGDFLGVIKYPKDDFRTSWERFLWHQFHDDLTGTSIPQAYEFSWNDELISLKRFDDLLSNAVSSVIAEMETSVKGIPVVVYNPLSIDREDIVEAFVDFGKNVPPYIAVFDNNGVEVPSQLLQDGDKLKVVFLADVPSVGFAVYDVRSSRNPKWFETGVVVEKNRLENAKYIVKIDNNGNISSIFDKDIHKEILTKPVELQILPNKPKRWPAWEIDYEDISAPPKAVVGGDTQLRVLEKGPARVAIEITRQYGESAFKQTVYLSAGRGGARIEVDNEVDWYESESLLKAAFSFISVNDSVTYDLGLGTIKRGLNHEKMYEVPAQQWADLSGAQKKYGIAVLNDCKYGYDHPDANTLRLTLIHTPGIYENWATWVGDQASQDKGAHRFKYAILGHDGGWRDGQVQYQAAKLNQPLMAFQSAKHKGNLGKSFSMLKLTDNAGNACKSVMVKALKKSENSGEYVIRLQELFGNNSSVVVNFTKPVLAAAEINGAEEGIGEAIIKEGKLTVYFTPYQLKTISVKIQQDYKPNASISGDPIILPCNSDGVSMDINRMDGNFDGQGNTISGDLLPAGLNYFGVDFIFGDKSDSAMNVYSCKGDTIKFTPGIYQEIWLIGAAVEDKVAAEFKIGEKETYKSNIENWLGRVGQWNNRVTGDTTFTDKKDEIQPGFIKDGIIAWTGTHYHTGDGQNTIYEYNNFWLTKIPLSKKAAYIVMPKDERIKFLAGSFVKRNYGDVKEVSNKQDFR